jgi:hypothetical protein
MSATIMMRMKAKFASVRRSATSAEHVEGSKVPQPADRTGQAVDALAVNTREPETPRSLPG